MTRRSVKIHRLRQSIYPVYMYVVVHSDISAAHMEVFGEEFHLAKCGGLLVSNGSRFYIFVQPNADADTIAHESFHMTVDVMEWCGFKVTKNHEPAAYLCGWIAGKVHKAILKHRLSPH